MATLKPALTDDDLKRIGGIANLRKAYSELAFNYNKIMNGDVVYCHACNDFHNAEAFYNDKRFPSGLYPTCKKMLMLKATDYDKKEKVYIDNREKTIEIFRELDIPFIDSLYNSALSNVQNSVGERNRQTAYQHTLTIVKSLPQYKGKTFNDSIFEEDNSLQSEDEINENSRILKTARKRFGKDYSNADLVFLENEYEDWTTRYSCENKAQELLFKRICFTTLNIEKAQRDGKDTKELDKTLQELMTSSQIKPSQSNSNALTESKTFGQLIDKWEKEKPIPEPEGEFKDIDKIGLLIDVFFKGHLSKMMGLKNAFSNTYEQYIKKYTVNKPQYDEESDVEGLFDQIFGSRIDED